MKLDEKQQTLVRLIPGVDHLLELTKTDPFFDDIPLSVVVNSIRTTVESRRKRILRSDPGITAEALSNDRILEAIKHTAQQALQPNLKRVINGTGIVVHTNLGRSLLAPTAIESLMTVVAGYSNLEYDLSAGRRGSRYSAVEDILCEISGAESALVVNNNAGAVLLCLETIANRREVIVSRGELVEIGGSFRIPDVMAKSGGILTEVGTTNRTHLKDYEKAISENTALLLKVHRSNYSVVGFTAEVSLHELMELGAQHHIPLMEDLGSGTFVDFARYGLTKEPTVQESVAAGVDVVTFSGDKLLGGPQAGIIVGKKPLLDQIKQNPIARALRIDKLTLAALEATLRLYRDEEKAMHDIPTLRMITQDTATIETKATQLSAKLEKIMDTRLDIRKINLASRTGGGALPLLELPSKCLQIRINGMTANALETAMRNNAPPIIGRIEEDSFILDLRTIQDDEIIIIQTAFINLLQRV